MLTKTTIHDIARELNYPYATISTDLNLSYFISKKTISAVQEKASELLYQLNIIASSLHSGKSGKKAFAFLMELIVNKDKKSIVKPCKKAVLEPLILYGNQVLEKNPTYLK